MHALQQLLISHGYAPEASAQFIAAPFVPAHCDEDTLERHLNALAGNFYMQLLGNKLLAFDFNLNRYDIPGDELNYADSLIHGRLGNAPMDEPLVAKLLEAMVITLRKKFQLQPFTWQELYADGYASPDGTKIEGKALIEALLASNPIHNGKVAKHYRHEYRGILYSTLTMHEVMAFVLKHGSSHALTAVNRFGLPIEGTAIDYMKRFARTLRHLHAPHFASFLEMNAHHKIMENLQQIFLLLHRGEYAQAELCRLSDKLRHENYNPHMYPPEWQRFLEQVDIALEAITSPHAAHAYMPQTPTHSARI